MQTVLFVLLVSIAVDLVGCIGLLVLVWIEHRRVRREAALAGEQVPSGGRQLGCLLIFALVSLGILSVTAWFLRNE